MGGRERGIFAPFDTHIGVFRNNLDVVKPFKCSNFYLKSKKVLEPLFGNITQLVSDLGFTRVNMSSHVIALQLSNFAEKLIKDVCRNSVWIKQRTNIRDKPCSFTQKLANPVH